jgi:hypothetical protein
MPGYWTHLFCGTFVSHYLGFSLESSGFFFLIISVYDTNYQSLSLSPVATAQGPSTSTSPASGLSSTIAATTPTPTVVTPAIPTPAATSPATGAMATGQRQAVNTKEPCQSACDLCKQYIHGMCYCFKCHKSWSELPPSAPQRQAVSLGFNDSFKGSPAQSAASTSTAVATEPNAPELLRDIRLRLSDPQSTANSAPAEGEFCVMFESLLRSRFARNRIQSFELEEYTVKLLFGSSHRLVKLIDTMQSSNTGPGFFSYLLNSASKVQEIEDLVDIEFHPSVMKRGEVVVDQSSSRWQVRTHIFLF